MNETSGPRTLRLLIAATLSILVVSLVVAVLWVIGSASGGRDRFSSLDIAPKDAVVYIAINTAPDSSQWIAFADTLDVLGARTPVDDAINDALAEFDLVWQDDILPLAGDEGYFALLAEDLNAGDVTWVGGFALRDARRAEQIFLDVAKEDGLELLGTDYEGVEIHFTEALTIEAELAGEQSSAVAFFENVMVIASTAEDVEVGIDVVMGRAPSAAENGQLKAATEQYGDDFIAWGYVDLGLFWDGFEDGFGSQPGLEGAEYSDFIDEARQSADRLSFALSAHAEGFVIDVSVLNSPDFVPGEYAAFSKQYETRLANRVPTSTMAFLSGYDIYSQGYLPLKDALSETSSGVGGDTIEDAIQELEDEVGLDFEGDFIELLDRELALSFNLSDLDEDQPSFDVLALFEVNEPDAMRQTFLDLGGYLNQQGLISVVSEREGIHRWTDLGGSGDGVAWTVFRDVLAVGYPEDTVLGFVAGVDNSLADTNDWKKTMELMPDDVTSLGYFSLSRLLHEIRSVDGAEEDFRDAFDGELTLDDFEPLRSIGFATTNIEGGTQTRIVVLVTE